MTSIVCVFVQFSVLPESSQTNELSLDALQEKLAVLPLEEGEEEEKSEGPEEQGEEGGENLSSTAGIFGSEGRTHNQCTMEPCHCGAHQKRIHFCVPIVAIPNKTALN